MPAPTEDRPHTVELTLVFESVASAEVTEQGWERLLDRLSAVSGAAPALLSLPAIERHDSELLLRWVGVQAAGVLGAQAQAAAFTEQLPMPGLREPVSLRSVVIAEED